MSLQTILHRKPKRPTGDHPFADTLLHPGGYHPYPDTPLPPGAQIERALARQTAPMGAVITGPPTEPWAPDFGSAEPPAPGTWHTDPETVRQLLDSLRDLNAAPVPEAPPASEAAPVPFAEDAGKEGLRFFREVLYAHGWCGLHARRDAPQPLPRRRNPSLDRWQARATVAADVAFRAAQAEIRQRAELFDARERFLRHRHVTGSAA